MGWNPFAWLLGKQEETPEQLVLGAELHCPYGSENSYLIVPTGRTCINDLPGACVRDRKKLENIRPFGQCALGGPCEDLMDLEERNHHINGHIRTGWCGGGAVDGTG